MTASIELDFSEVGSEIDIELPRKNYRFQFDYEKGKKVLEIAKMSSFEKIKENFYHTIKFKPAGIIKISN